MLTEDEKQALECIIKENPDKGRLQQQLEEYLSRVLDGIIAMEEESEGRA